MCIDALKTWGLIFSQNEELERRSLRVCRECARGRKLPGPELSGKKLIERLLENPKRQLSRGSVEGEENKKPKPESWLPSLSHRSFFGRMKLCVLSRPQKAFGAESTSVLAKGAKSWLN